jgi:hypothetical protein
VIGFIQNRAKLGYPDKPDNRKIPDHLLPPFSNRATTLDEKRHHRHGCPPSPIRRNATVTRQVESVFAAAVTLGGVIKNNGARPDANKIVRRRLC